MVSPRTASEFHQPRSQTTLSLKQPSRGAAPKRNSPAHGLQDKYTSHPKYKSGVKIVHNKDEEAMPTSGLLWYRGPVYGALPGRTLRSHSTTTIRNKAWVIGGYDDKQSYRDIYCLDLETLQWSHPEYKGDIPPPCRGHTATAVDHRIFVIGGMSTHATSEPITVYVFDTLTLSWTRPRIALGSSPVQRRAHSAVYWDEKIWIFGGGNGFTALNDVWSLDVSPIINGRRTVIYRTEPSALKWEKVEKQDNSPDSTPCGNWPDARGYHTADVVDNFMFIIGGADGQNVLDSIWVLNLGTKVWHHLDWLKGSSLTSRLAHSSTRLGPYLFIFGGVGKEYNSELHLLNLVTLQEERRRVYGKAPMPRGYHTTVHGNGRIHVIGGANATYGFDDVWILELASLAYLPQITDFKVEPLEDIGWY
ncbi:hypothetical protein AGABI1DRAFT_108955 [Agaricus bisporus var. burnettii JB137-S8]|uniref:Galactose oxidase n=1 Tax=Agaricus bisporus var. burnettii (strain JB137-S8 / ATCC MYA-4627 / FGSC 10392) TaxID=597362 RepID=K5XNI7_AGABU|nr:uncharacterized protein AGABI1DRAFT_108955 [Agaricus bisporus var. burnettii JB137-S8]EKM76210.1 hypothetical protein AGABI1DRAFT_108955 [Agaricus bisporus var. burnettii JB137-S8]